MFIMINNTISLKHCYPDEFVLLKEFECFDGSIPRVKSNCRWSQPPMKCKRYHFLYMHMFCSSINPFCKYSVINWHTCIILSNHYQIYQSNSLNYLVVRS